MYEYGISLGFWNWTRSMLNYFASWIIITVNCRDQSWVFASRKWMCALTYLKRNVLACERERRVRFFTRDFLPIPMLNAGSVIFTKIYIPLIFVVCEEIWKRMFTVLLSMICNFYNISSSFLMIIITLYRTPVNCKGRCSTWSVYSVMSIQLKTFSDVCPVIVFSNLELIVSVPDIYFVLLNYFFSKLSTIMTCAYYYLKKICLCPFYIIKIFFFFCIHWLKKGRLKQTFL